MSDITRSNWTDGATAGAWAKRPSTKTVTFVLTGTSIAAPTGALSAHVTDSGVAVITANGSALKEIAEGYAHLVDPLDVDAIADAIGYCMTDTEHREALAKLGRRRPEDFHWKRTAEKTLEIYRSVLASKEPAKKPAGAPAAPGKPPGDDGGEAPSAASQPPERALAEEP